MKWIQNWFSNFIPFEEPLRYDGEEYVTPEHFYQAMKSKDKRERAFIAEQTLPGTAKKMGRTVVLRDDWEQIKRDVMIYVQRYRFRTGTEMREKLLATGNDEIVEWNNWHDRIWGRCKCYRCGGNGSNMLGEILMQIRDEIRNGGG